MCCIAGAIVRVIALPLKLAAKVGEKAAKVLAKGGAKACSGVAKAGGKICKGCGNCGARALRAGGNACGKASNSIAAVYKKGTKCLPKKFPECLPKRCPKCLPEGWVQRVENSGNRVCKPCRRCSEKLPCKKYVPGLALTLSCKAWRENRKRKRRSNDRKEPWNESEENSPKESNRKRHRRREGQSGKSKRTKKGEQDGNETTDTARNRKLNKRKRDKAKRIEKEQQNGGATPRDNEDVERDGQVGRKGRERKKKASNSERKRAKRREKEASKALEENKHAEGTALRAVRASEAKQQSQTNEREREEEKTSHSATSLSKPGKTARHVGIGGDNSPRSKGESRKVDVRGKDETAEATDKTSINKNLEEDKAHTERRELRHYRRAKRKEIEQSDEVQKMQKHRKQGEAELGIQVNDASTNATERCQDNQHKEKEAKSKRRHSHADGRARKVAEGQDSGSSSSGEEEVEPVERSEANETAREAEPDDTSATPRNENSPRTKVQQKRSAPEKTPSKNKEGNEASSKQAEREERGEQKEGREKPIVKADRRKRPKQLKTEDVTSSKKELGREVENVQTERKKQPERFAAEEESKSENREERLKTPKTLIVTPSEGKADDAKKPLARSGNEEQPKLDLKGTSPEDAAVSWAAATDKQMKPAQKLEGSGTSGGAATAAMKHDDEKGDSEFRRERETLSSEGWILTGIECRLLPECACYDRFRNRSPQ